MQQPGNPPYEQIRKTHSQKKFLFIYFFSAFYEKKTSLAHTEEKK